MRVRSNWNRADAALEPDRATERVLPAEGETEAAEASLAVPRMTPASTSTAAVMRARIRTRRGASVESGVE